MDLAALVSYLDRYLRTQAVPDAPHALNGLQVANGGTVRRVAAAVDVCAATVRLAAEQGADLLLVHHGLFWGGLLPLTERLYERVAGLIGQDAAAPGVRPRAGAAGGHRDRGRGFDDPASGGRGPRHLHHGRGRAPQLL